MQPVRDIRPFSIDGALKPTRNVKFNRMLEAALEKVLYLARLNRLYQALPAELDADNAW